jgi:hypothetical protein
MLTALPDAVVSRVARFLGERATRATYGRDGDGPVILAQTFVFPDGCIEALDAPRRARRLAAQPSCRDPRLLIFREVLDSALVVWGGPFAPRAGVAAPVGACAGVELHFFPRQGPLPPGFPLAASRCGPLEVAERADFCVTRLHDADGSAASLADNGLCLEGHGGPGAAAWPDDGAECWGGLTLLACPQGAAGTASVRQTGLLLLKRGVWMVPRALAAASRGCSAALRGKLGGRDGSVLEPSLFAAAPAPPPSQVEWRVRGSAEVGRLLAACGCPASAALDARLDALEIYDANELRRRPERWRELSLAVPGGLATVVALASALHEATRDEPVVVFGAVGRLAPAEGAVDPFLLEAPVLPSTRTALGAAYVAAARLEEFLAGLAPDVAVLALDAPKGAAGGGAPPSALAMALAVFCGGTRLDLPELPPWGGAAAEGQGVAYARLPRHPADLLRLHRRVRHAVRFLHLDGFRNELVVVTAAADRRDALARALETCFFSPHSDVTKAAAFATVQLCLVV